MTQLLKGLAGGRIILCLEGGYNVTSISYAMTMCTKALLGDPIQQHYEPKQTCHWSAVESINNVIKTHQKYWKSLKFHVALPSEDVLEAPLPSRGLEEDQNGTIELSHSPETFDDKNVEDSRNTLEDTLDEHMAMLKIENKCQDGIHCGTDDEDDKTPECSKVKCHKAGNTEGSNVSTKLEGGSSSGICSDKDVQEACLKPCVEESSKISENQTLVDYLSENMQAIVDGEMFAVIPVPWCPHLDSLYAIPSDVKFEQGVKCVDCDHTVENWVCLHCYIVSMQY